MTEEMYDIPRAAAELDLSAAYIRLRVREGVIKSTLVPIKEGSTVMKHVISKSELMAFASRERAKMPRRNDGRGKCTLYAMPDEVDRIKELLYATHDPGLAIVAQSLTGGKSNGHDNYVPPSKRRPSNE